MIKIYAWNNGNGYNVEVDEIFAETLRNALTEALTNEKRRGHAVGDIFEIDVEIKDD